MKEYICVREISGGIYTHTEFTPVRELVRCKYCIYRNKPEYCPCYRDRWDQDDWFCADGRRQ